MLCRARAAAHGGELLVLGGIAGGVDQIVSDASELSRADGAFDSGVVHGSWSKHEGLNRPPRCCVHTVASACRRPGKQESYPASRR